MTARQNKLSTKLIRRKMFLTVAVTALAVPQFANAQVSNPTAAEEARAAELMCEVAGICGDLAATESARTKETQDGKSTRAMMSIGTVKATIPNRNVGEAAAPVTRNVVREPVPATRSDDSWQTASTMRATTTVASGKTQAANEFRGQLMVNFALGSAELTDDSMFDIRSFVLAVKKLDEQGHRKKFRIEGHADSSGTESINLPLSASRAKAVRDLIVSTGLEEGRIEYAGYGSSVPLPGVQSDNYLNRRVEAVLIE